MRRYAVVLPLNQPTVRAPVSGTNPAAFPYRGDPPRKEEP